MANLNPKMILLLDKLYNLKGADNIILQELVSKIEGVNNAIQEKEQRGTDLTREKETNKNDLLLFSTQEEAFRTAFTGVDDDTFSALREIGIDLRIGTMMTTVSDKAPLYIKTLNERIERIQTEIDKNIEIKKDLNGQLSDLENQKTQAENDRDVLVSLLEQCLSKDETERESLPTKYVKDVISRFGIFETSEVSTLTKLLMFPEDGLLEYDSTYEDRLRNGQVGVVEEIPYEEPVVEEPKKEEEPKPEPKQEEQREEKVYREEPRLEQKPIIQREFAVQDVVEPPKDDVDRTSIIDLTALNGDKQEKVEEEQSISDFLESIGLDLSHFREENDKDSSIDRLMSELSATDKDLIKGNYELLRSLNAEVAAYRYRRNHSYLNDPDLNQKVTFLRVKGISDKRIRELLERASSGLRESLDTIEARFNAAETLGVKIDDEHTEVLGRDIVKLANNIKLLGNNEITLDEKELRNYRYILTESDYIGADLEILKNYLINITRSNDKYALNVFAKDPYDLLTDIDNIIENNLEDVLSTNPEVLTGRNGAFVDRVKYYERQGKPIIDTTGKNAYAPYVLSSLEALKENGGAPIPISPSEEEINPKLPSIIGNENTVTDLVNALASYYNGRSDFSELDLSNELNETYERLLDMFEQTYHSERVGKHTYKVADNYISKQKLERHLKVILLSLAQKGETVDGIENEVLLTSMLYNLRQDVETLTKLVETCLGFNEENTLGGRAL